MEKASKRRQLLLLLSVSNGTCGKFADELFFVLIFISAFTTISNIRLHLFFACPAIVLAELILPEMIAFFQKQQQPHFFIPSAFTHQLNLFWNPRTPEQVQEIPNNIANSLNIQHAHLQQESIPLIQSEMSKNSTFNNSDETSNSTEVSFFNTSTTTTTPRATTRTPYHRRPCKDEDMNCFVWVACEPEKCVKDVYVQKKCRRACDACGTLDEPIEERYNLKRVPEPLQKVAFLIGRWQSDFGGKADFPTIPRFTYGEKLDFSIATVQGSPMLNYTAFAWDNSDFTELHSESGFLVGQTDSSRVALNTVMSNGFATLETGEEQDYSIRFELERIGRINFSRDLPVRKMIREWTLLNATHLESRLQMGTMTHRMLLHTQIIYERVWP